MWVRIAADCSTKWYPALKAGDNHDLDEDSAHDLIAKGQAIEIPPQSSGESQVPASRQVGTSAPLAGGGTLAANLTISIPKATASVDGYLDKGDFSTFAAKQASLSVKVPISSAELLALQTTAKAILATQGATKAIIPIRLVLQFKHGATPYTIGDPDNAFQLQYAGKTAPLFSVPATGLADQAADELNFALPSAAAVIPQADAANLGVELKLVGSTPALTAGDGTITATLFYAVADLS